MKREHGVGNVLALLFVKMPPSFECFYREGKEPVDRKGASKVWGRKKIHKIGCRLARVPPKAKHQMRTLHEGDLFWQMIPRDR